MIFNSGLESLLALLITLGVASAAALVAFIIYRLLHPKLKDQHEMDEKQMAQETLDHYLQPVEDEETAREIENYKDSEDE